MTTVLVGQPVGADEVVADYLDHVATLGLSGGRYATGFGSLATSPHATATCTPG
ncbi:phage integrase family domain protein [Mycobacterium sp. MAC_080597_8934]|uniref:hypothetical protein n=1 Tax=Mycobacterium sp. MAC_080597_8934 TaxID=1335322 RepID=UPI000452DE18|nr:hypothetical protein [Mycobacterium sp. MAC_080597_8934]ETZ59134.1 phage integrase family domain protein [Mycobacterium sp. MAC_080597_8934]